VAGQDVGATNWAPEREALSTTAEIVVPLRYSRRSVVIENIDTAITVYVGTTAAAVVVAATRKQILPGASIELKTSADVYMVAASGTPNVEFIEYYD